MFHQFFNPLDLALLILACVSLPLYISVLYVIWKYRTEHPFKNSSFFRLCLLMGVVDCAQLVYVYVVWKLPYWGVGSGFFVSLKYWPNAQYFVCNFLPYVQTFLVATIALNRYLSLAHSAMALEVCESVST